MNCFEQRKHILSIKLVVGITQIANRAPSVVWDITGFKTLLFPSVCLKISIPEHYYFAIRWKKVEKN